MTFDIVFITSLLTLIYLIWFDSSAFEEYAKLIGGAKFFGVKEYEDKRQNDATLTYHQYLLTNKNSFFIRLITCPLCFSVWASLAVTFVYTDSLLLTPICNIASLILYMLTIRLFGD